MYVDVLEQDKANYLYVENIKCIENVDSAVLRQIEAIAMLSDVRWPLAPTKYIDANMIKLKFICVAKGDVQPNLIRIVPDNALSPNILRMICFPEVRIYNHFSLK